eukprot:gnl/MRDRNA2_/MRDRNA2_141755_c0_seq1.p1 gnl/MRDRNA2_/MRDRNA2_141755_c0~~gnl/MRDRNA2_/MRDRNA2_141755_c0_seq1.p1  ORF type:complete len:549 (-),score=103.09 gnl/MRDRNA2_/MRDRNA2_141755_c0_seq1:3-1649(-)
MLHNVAVLLIPLLIHQVVGKRANLHYALVDQVDIKPTEGGKLSSTAMDNKPPGGGEVDNSRARAMQVQTEGVVENSAAVKDVPLHRNTGVQHQTVNEDNWNQTVEHTEQHSTFVDDNSNETARSARADQHQDVSRHVPQSLSQLKEHLLTADVMESGFKLIMVLLLIVVAFWFLCGMKKQMKDFNFRSWFGIGDFLLAAGIDKYRTFHLSLIIDKVHYMEDLSTAVRITAGRNTVSTNKATSVYGIHETLTIAVAQGTHEIVVELVDDPKKNTHLAVKKITIDEVCRLAQEVEKTVLVLKRKGKKLSQDPQLFITFCTDGAEDEEEDDDTLMGVNIGNLSAEMQLKLKEAKKAEKGRRTSGGDKSESDDAEKPSKLQFLSTTCRGPLSKHDHFARTSDYYFAVYQAGKDTAPKAYNGNSKAAIVSWCLGWWKDEGDFKKEDRPVGCVSMLRVTNVYPVPDKPNVFCIRHVLKSREKEDMFLSRVDRSRDVWVESVHLFIEQLRQSRAEVAAEPDDESRGGHSDADTHSGADKHHHGHKSHHPKHGDSD